MLCLPESARVFNAFRMAAADAMNNLATFNDKVERLVLAPNATNNGRLQGAIGQRHRVGVVGCLATR